MTFCIEFLPKMRSFIQYSMSAASPRREEGRHSGPEGVVGGAGDSAFHQVELSSLIK